MRIYQHFSVVGFCNTYVVGEKQGGEAILIDPGHVDNELISIIEQNNYIISTILLTHRHESHTRGVGTLLKLYKPTIYAYTSKVYDFKVIEIAGNSKINCGGIEVETIHLPGHSVDSLVYKIGHALFTGDTLMATRIGSTPGYIERSILIKIIREKLLNFDENLIVFPGHGAPTKIKNEILFNPDLTEETVSPWLRNQMKQERNNRF
ncbi:MAG: MBL fold metallo-hydrolase [Pleomorphochaeta sp.]|jgi:glyoxylase-like metal-dependent hydrolase (beta-lactamase superfamily II)